MIVPRYAIFGIPGESPLPPTLSDTGRRMKWELTTRDGHAIASFQNRKSSRVEIELNSRKTATLAVSIYDEFADRVVALETLLKCWYGDQIIYAGPVVVPDFDFSGGLVTITSFDTFFLERNFLGAQTPYNTDHAQIIKNLVEVQAAPGVAGVPGHGIQIGATPATTTRQQTYEPGQQVWAAITDLTGILNAPDFTLDPVDQTDGIWATLNLWSPRKGSDLSQAVQFEYGVGRNNCVDFKWGPSGEIVRNRQTVVGQAQDAAIAPSYTADDTASQLLRGLVEGWEGSFGSDNAAIVQARAQEVVAAYARPPDFFSIQPAIEGLDEGYGVPPQVFADYNIGDTVNVVAKRGNLVVDVTGRVTGIALEEATSAGDARVTLKCVPTVQVGGIV